MNTQALLVFIIIAYAVPWGIGTAIEMSGVIEDGTAPIWILWALYLFPALGAWAASRLDPLPGGAPYHIWPLKWPRAIVAVVAVAGVFLLVVGAQVVFNVAEPDWELTRLTRIFQENDMTVTAHPANFFVLGVIVTMILGVFYAVLALAGEYAWRGYLLPRMTRLGWIRANVVVGVAWGVWFVPLAFSEAVNVADPYSAIARVILMALILSFILGEIVRRTKSLALCAVIVGAFAAQLSDSIAFFLFPRPNPPWSGMIGYVSVAIWLIAALVIWFWPKGAVTAEQNPAA